MNPSEQPQPSSQVVDSSEKETALAKWQDLEVRWKSLLGLEASMDTLRISMEGLRAEMEASFKRTLTADEKLHALAADVIQWNKAKTRVHYALPRTSEFIHRAIWAKGSPERKSLEELFRSSIGANIPLSEMDKILEDLEIVRKDRQTLAAHGVAVYQEGKNITAEIQGALRRLQSNAAARAAKKKSAAGARGKLI